MKILQIIPATPGWYLATKYAESEIALWALVEDYHGQRIIPLTEGHDPCTYANDGVFSIGLSEDSECYFRKPEEDK